MHIWDGVYFSTCLLDRLMKRLGGLAIIGLLIRCCDWVSDFHWSRVRPIVSTDACYVTNMGNQCGGH